MGDRGNIVVVDEFSPQPIYLYTHWTGTEMAETLSQALKRNQRWNDGPYLTRIIFSEMVRGDEDGETGHGISTAPPDNEHPYLIVDVARQRVLIGDASQPGAVAAAVATTDPEGYAVVPFADADRIPMEYEAAHGR